MESREPSSDLLNLFSEGHFNKLFADPKEESLGTRQRLELDLVICCLVLSDLHSIKLISFSLGASMLSDLGVV